MGKTSEQAAALRQLRGLAQPYRFRVETDSEGFPIIPGRYGQVEWHDSRELAVYCDHPKLFEKLGTIPGIRRHQSGDGEMRALFPPEALDQVAGVIRAKRRRGVSSDTARKLGFSPRNKGHFPAQEAPSVRPDKG